ncbi:MAG: substrate-binding domain-containing protein [Endomicrobia bacterium]|nr:substrate-binding domain-containing protein [Endomicrobiia bacterium]
MQLQFPQFSKKQRVTLKVVMTLLGISFISYALYFALMAFSFFGETFFMALAVISAVLAIVFCVMFLFLENNKRHFRALFIVFAAIVVLSAAIIIVCKSYQNSIPKVLAANGVDLTDYIPFHGAKVAKLDKPATLELEKDFPVMDGATALYPVYAAFAQAVYPELAKEEEPSVTRNRFIVCNNTKYAYDDLLRGAADIIFVASPSQRHIDDAKKAGKDLQFVPIGREALVFFVNKKNPVNSLTLQQLRDIYSGRVTSWKKVGGKRGKIKAFQRAEGSGSQTALEELMKGDKITAPLRERISAGKGAKAEAVADYRNYNNALGFTFRFFVEEMAGRDQIKILSIDGIAPTEENITSGRYPFTSEFYAVTASGSDINGNSGKKQSTEKVIKWILSDEGQELVEKSGYVPMQEHVKKPS